MIRHAVREARAGFTAGVVPPYDRSANAAGVTVTPDSALRNVNFHAAVRVLADTMSLLVPRYKLGPLPSVFGDPGPDTTWPDIMFQLASSLAMRGNAYAIAVEFDARGVTTGVVVLSPDAVVPMRLEGVLWYRVAGLGLVPARDMLHFRWFLRAGEDLGLSTIEYAATDIGLGIAAAAFGAAWFRDNASPSAVLQTKAEKLSKEATEALQSQWQELHSGKRRTAVLTAGLEWKPIQISPNESQFIDTLNVNAETLARWVGVPPHKIGSLQHATFSNIEHSAIEYVMDSILPKANRMAHTWARHLKLDPMAFELSTRRLVKADSKTEAEVLEIEARNGVVNADTWAEEVGRPAIPDGLGAAYTMPLNMSERGKGEDAKSTQARAAAAAALVLAGYDPAAALATVGLPPTAWIGPTPKVDAAVVSAIAAPPAEVPPA